MKKLYLVVFGFVSINFASAQIVIGKETVSSSAVLLEFGDENRGIVLPQVSDANSVDDASDLIRGSTGGANAGTLIFDSSDNRIKLKTNHGWTDLSGRNGKSDSNELIGLVENQNAKIIIGGETSAADGILVLESNSKVMVLPKVNDYKDIIDPSPGMMVYLRNIKSLAVFNGEVWSFWKPE